jgi:hypothetical protein
VAETRVKNLDADLASSRGSDLDIFNGEGYNSIISTLHQDSTILLDLRFPASQATAALQVIVCMNRIRARYDDDDGVS